MQKSINFWLRTLFMFRKHTANMRLEVVYEKIFARFPEMEQDGEMILTPNNFVNAIQANAS